jgi:hypothetical protein
MVIILVPLLLLAVVAVIAFRAYRARTRPLVASVALQASPYVMAAPIRPISPLHPGLGNLLAWLAAVLLPVGLVYLFSPSAALHLLPIWAGVLFLTYLLPYLFNRRNR